jgi:transketolase
MRNTFAEAVYQAAKTDPRIYVVVADISPAGAISQFSQEWPDRFINTGVAEQNMISISAGLAMRGMRPFAYTIATFSIYRPFEMVRNDVCYQELPVTIVGMGTGVVYSTLGSTHHAQEDIAVAGAIPNMRIIAPCDPAEVTEAVNYCTSEANNGPLYLRLGKAGEPVVTENAAEPWVYGKIRYIERGTDVCLITHGSIISRGLELVEYLRAQGKSVSVISAHTLKPFDAEGIAQALRSHKQAIVIEEHSPQGGLAALTKQAAWDAGVDCDLRTFTLKDEFIHCYGSHQDILAEHGLSLEALISGVQ